MYAYVRDAWARPDKSEVKAMLWDRMQEWRREGSVTRLEHPTRIDRARALGYKAKQGIAVVRVQVRRGGRRASRYIQPAGPHAWVRINLRRGRASSGSPRNAHPAGTRTWKSSTGTGLVRTGS